MKRLATTEEVEVAFQRHVTLNKTKTEAEWKAELEKAYEEGHKDEYCITCNRVFLAFIHFVRCDETNCPMRGTGPSVLGMLLGLDGKECEGCDKYKAHEEGKHMEPNNCVTWLSNAEECPMDKELSND